MYCAWYFENGQIFNDLMEWHLPFSRQNFEDYPYFWVLMITWSHFLTLVMRKKAKLKKIHLCKGCTNSPSEG